MTNEAPQSRAAGVDLNTASEQVLSSALGLDSDMIQQLVQVRPLRSWDDVARLAGFTAPQLRALQHAGARIGGPDGGGDRPGRVHA
ncbi:type II secretion system protein GspK [Ramlibacter sp. AN1015]|uniref:type II secretion system protein GspK n=1 Tax=Ramlibacter sp. AN1015 TaxID=3133428 RepID=UPI0030C5C95A